MNEGREGGVRRARARGAGGPRAGPGPRLPHCAHGHHLLLPQISILDVSFVFSVFAFRRGGSPPAAVRAGRVSVPPRPAGASRRPASRRGRRAPGLLSVRSCELGALWGKVFFKVLAKERREAHRRPVAAAAPFRRRQRAHARAATRPRPVSAEGLGGRGGVVWPFLVCVPPQNAR